MPDRADPTRLAEFRAEASQLFERESGRAWNDKATDQFRKELLRRLGEDANAGALLGRLRSVLDEAYKVTEVHGVSPGPNKLGKLLDAPPRLGELAAILFEHDAALSKIRSPRRKREESERSRRKREDVTAHSLVVELFGMAYSGDRLSANPVPQGASWDATIAGFPIRMAEIDPPKGFALRPPSPTELAAISILVREDLRVEAGDTFKTVLDRERRAILELQRRRKGHG